MRTDQSIDVESADAELVEDRDTVYDVSDGRTASRGRWELDFHEPDGFAFTVKGTPGDLAALLTKHAAHLTGDHGNNDAIAAMAANLTAHGTRITESSVQTYEDGEGYPCENGCGDGLGRREASYDLTSNTWSYLLSWGCYSGADGEGLALEDLITELKGLAFAGLKDLVEYAIAKLRAFI